MAGRHTEEITAIVSGTPVALDWSKLDHITGVSSYVGLFINESDGTFYVLTDESLSTGPRIGSVADTDPSLPAGTFLYGEKVWLLAGTASSVTYVLIEAA